MSLGGSSTQKTEIPKWLSDAAQGNIARANQASAIPFAPYFGPDVAAFTPQETAAMQNTNQAAQAFGLNTADLSAGMPQETSYGGMGGYSAQPLYANALTALQAASPGTYDAIRAMFIDPQTGAAPEWLSAAQGGAQPGMVQPNAAAPGFDQRGDSRQNAFDNSPWGGSATPAGSERPYGRSNPPPAGGGGFLGTGYDSIRDILDGGGSGGSYWSI